MKRSTRWLIGTIGCLATIVVTLGIWSWLAERQAISRLLSTGAFIAFESDGRANELLGYYSGHDSDDRVPRLWTESDEDIVANGAATPTGSAWALTLPSDDAVDVVLQERWAFQDVEDIHLYEGISENTAAALLKACRSGELNLSGVTCYARISRQQTLDLLLQLPLKSLLIGCPEIERPDLSMLRKNKTLKELWIHEGDAGCECCSNPSRYNATDLSAIASVGSLKILYLGGIRLTDAMTDTLAGAKQLETLMISQCLISQTAADKLSAALPNTQVTITTPEAASEENASDSENP